jgi:hypothetical protein
MEWKNWEPVVVVPLTVGTVAVVTFVFQANANAAAAFFGSLTAAGATVAAVLLTARFNRDNERLRYRREQAHRDRAAATEFMVRQSQMAMEATRLSEVCATYLDKKAAADPSFEERSAEAWAHILDAACAPTPERLMESLGRFDQASTEALIVSVRRSATFRRALERDAKAKKEGDPFRDKTLKNIKGFLDGIAKDANAAAKALREYLSSLPQE